MFKPHELLGYVYLASPYSHPEQSTKNNRYEIAQDAAVWLASQGHVVYSPIAHWHPIAMRRKLPEGIDFWHDQDRMMVREAKEGLVVLQISGWRESRGVGLEIEWALEFGLPIRKMAGVYNLTTDETKWLLMSFPGDPRKP